MSELAWAAGFFDGEGCTGLSRRDKGQYLGIVVTVTQVHTEPLERLQRALGTGKIRGPYREHEAGRKNPVYRWSVNRFSDAEKALQLMWPWLCSIKRAQASAALEKVRAWRAAYAARKPPCGHEYDLIERDGTRRCRACARQRRKGYYQTRREAILQYQKDWVARPGNRQRKNANQRRLYHLKLIRQKLEKG